MSSPVGASSGGRSRFAAGSTSPVTRCGFPADPPLCRPGPGRPVASTLTPMLAADPRPGCPARRSPATGSSSPVARFGLPSAPPSPPKVHRRRKRIILLPAPLAPREPGWPSTSPRPPLLAAAVRWHRSSGSGWRCADRYGAYIARQVVPGQEVFFHFTGLSTNIPGYPQNFFVRPPFAHKLFTTPTHFDGARRPLR
jgi:hypothetical protein